MPYALKATATALKEYDRLPRQTQQRVRATVKSLQDNPRSPGAIKLTGEEYYRIRVGDYRVLYEIDDQTQAITILMVKHRKDVYRDL